MNTVKQIRSGWYRDGPEPLCARISGETSVNDKIFACGAKAAQRGAQGARKGD